MDTTYTGARRDVVRERLADALTHLDGAVDLADEISSATDDAAIEDRYLTLAANLGQLSRSLATIAQRLDRQEAGRPTVDLPWRLTP